MSGRNSTRLGLGFIAVLAMLLRCTRCHEGHEEDDPPCSATDNPLRIVAPYAPGTVTVDGQPGDWESIDGQITELHQALGDASGQPLVYPQGNGHITVKAAHDGKDVFFLVKVPGAFVYTPGNHHLSISAALMFGIGDDATLYNMGGCPQQPGHCSPEACRNHEVDLVHFEIDAAIPGRQYGRNILDVLAGQGNDRFGNLSDGYGFNPHCKYQDGAPEGAVGLAENDWVGVWSHTTVSTSYGLVDRDSPYGTAGDSGNFIFEFSRPLRTSDHFQQDVQFTVGSEHRLSVAVWYPLDGQPWQDSQHYILSCDWAVLTLATAPVPMYGWSYSSSTSGISTTAATALSAMGMVLSLAAVFVSIVVGWWVKANVRQFDNIEGL